MNALIQEELFPEETLQRLPLSYRYMARLHSEGFQENFSHHRFSRSWMHASNAYIGTGTYKPLHDIVLQDLFAD